MIKNTRKVSNIRYASIREMDISNGEGVGVALFVQGCPFNPHCYNCFNPDTWDFDGGKEWTPKVKEKFLQLIDRPYIKRVSILGGEPLFDQNLDDVLDLVTEINKRYNMPQYIVHNNCNNHNILNKNTDEIRLSSGRKNIWLYTGYTLNLENGYIPVDDFWNEEDEQYSYFTTTPSENLSTDLKRRKIIHQCNVVVDGRYIDEQRDITLKWRGSKNQRVISVQESLKQGKVITVV